MEKHILKKENVTPCITFGGITIGIVCVCIIAPESTGVIALLVSIPVFLLSLLKLIVEVTESINDLLTEKLHRDEQNPPNMIIVYEWMNKKENIKETIDDYDMFLGRFNIIDRSDKSFEYYVKMIKNDFRIIKLRRKVRLLRKILLGIYYGLIMFIIIVLILHYEISDVILSNTSSITNLSNILALVSLVIVLFEVVMNDVVKDIIITFFYKIYKVDLDF